MNVKTSRQPKRGPRPGNAPQRSNRGRVPSRTTNPPVPMQAPRGRPVGLGGKPSNPRPAQPIQAALVGAAPLPKTLSKGEVDDGGPIVLSVNFPISMGGDVLKQAWPNVAFKVAPHAIPHSHPNLAIARQLGYRMIMMLVAHEHRDRSVHADTIVVSDVGGRLAYAYQQNKNHANLQVHCMAPKLSNEDFLRVERLDVPQCEHVLNDCECHVGATLVFNHSLYYINPLDLASAMARRVVDGRTVAFALVHEWPDVAGRIAEATYHRIGEDKVRMSIPGGRDYEHCALNWLKTPKHRLLTPSGVLLWDVVRPVGNPTRPIAWVYKFTVIPTGLLAWDLEDFQNPTISWDNADAWGNNYTGEVHGLEHLQLGSETVKVLSAYTIGDLFVLRLDRKSVV